MTFKDAQVGMQLYVFDRTNLTLKITKITNFVASHFDPNIASGKMAVEVTDSDNHKYTIDDGLIIAYFNNCAISIDREVILREIETFKIKSENVLAEVPRHEEIVKKCNELLVENNPKLKEKQENENRFNNIESSIGELKNMFAEFMKRSSSTNTF